MEAPLTWLDRTLAAPTIGLLLEPHLVHSGEYAKALMPSLQKWASELPKLEVVSANPFSFQATHGPGFQYRFDHENLVAQFSYRAEMKDTPGGAPIVHLPGGVRPYSDLIAEMLVEVGGLILLLQQAGIRQRVRRIGIVADVRLNGTALPPGVERYVAHLTRPWGGRLQKCQTDLLATVAEAPAHVDRCHHRYDATVDRGDDVRLTLDWQRFYGESVSLPHGKEKLASYLAEAAKDASNYFSRFAEGDLAYE